MIRILPRPSQFSVNKNFVSLERFAISGTVEGTETCLEWSEKSKN